MTGAAEEVEVVVVDCDGGGGGEAIDERCSLSVPIGPEKMAVDGRVRLAAVRPLCSGMDGVAFGLFHTITPTRMSRSGGAFARSFGREVIKSGTGSPAANGIIYISFTEASV
jgi:hypothetical protein